MNCLCPKCNATIAPDVTDVPSDGIFLKCPECGAGFDLQRKSFATRSICKGTGITCAECGNTPGSTIYCQSCHALYPDFYVTETTSAAKKKLNKILAALTKPAKLKALPGHYPQDVKHIRTTASAAPVSSKGVKLPVSGRLMQAVSAIIILALIGGGGYYYYQDKIETEYSANYVRTIYAIKTTADNNIRLSTKLASDWRTSLSPSAPRFSDKEQKSLKSGKSDVDILMKGIATPPKRLVESRAAINKFYDSYTKLYDLNSLPPSTLDGFATTAKKLEDDFRKSGRELKAGMPPKIADTFKESLTKYKNLNDL
jgi:hypothetical protein